VSRGLNLVKILPLFLTCVCSAPASAQTQVELPCGFLGEGEFRESVQNLKELILPLRISSAAIEITILDRDHYPSGSCSGAYISDDGAILTASHCFDQCRFYEKDSPRILGSAEDQCAVIINGVRQFVQVIKASKCSLASKSKFFLDREHSRKIDDECAGGISDLAVIRPTNLQSIGEFSCLHTENGNSNFSQSVYAIGFPGKTTGRRPGKNALGDSLEFSAGNIVDTKRCEYWRYPDAEEAATGSTLQHGDFEFDKLPVPDVIQTAADAVPGSSGGPLVNLQGKIIGVASFTARQGQLSFQNNQYSCPGSSFFQTVEGFADKVGGSWGNCEKKLAK
jgi:hypothetical protein